MKVDVVNMTRSTFTFTFIRVLSILFLLSIFFKGFFPIKQTSNGFSEERINPAEICKDKGLVDLNLVLWDRVDNNKSVAGRHNISRSSQSDLDNVDSAKYASAYIDNFNKKPKFKHFKRLILLVIDALRADFVLNSFTYMTELRKILVSGHGYQFKAETHPPTVTLPRIKALTTGSIPGFVDVIFNFGSPALEEDNIITQMKQQGQRIVFYGDDTWLKLFPDHFERSEGTTSFFVTDYTEVDKNVSRHLPSELDNTQWDIMLLHYLGLDHIGHLNGPTSSLIKPKLIEMDQVIRQIYSAMEQWDPESPSLLVICGDHGMSDQGGHGGATAAEISVPVVFLSPHIVNKNPMNIGLISQIDLCPTLSVMLGLPVPKNNVGKIITDALGQYTVEQKVSVIQQNAEQVIRILRRYTSDLEKESSYFMYENAQRRCGEWLSERNKISTTAWEKQGSKIQIMFLESLKLAEEKIGKLSAEYDVYAIVASIFLLWLLLMSLVVSHFEKAEHGIAADLPSQASRIAAIVFSAILSHITMCTGDLSSSLLCGTSLTSGLVQFMLCAILLICSLHLFTQMPRCVPGVMQQFQKWKRKITLTEAFLVIGTIVHSFTLLSSSFVEEEHQTLYFFTTTVHVLLLLQLIFRFKLPMLAGTSRTCYKPIPHSPFLHQRLHPKLDMHGKNCDSDQNDNAFSGFDGFEECSVSSRIPSGTSRNLFLNQSHSESLCDSAREQNNCQNIYDDEDTQRKICGKDVDIGVVRMSLSAFIHFALSLLLIILMLRILRRWNQTGNKWLDMPDFGDWLVRPQNKHILSMVVVFSLMIIGASRKAQVRSVQSLCINLSLTFSYLHRVATGSLFFPKISFLSDKGTVEAKTSFIFIALTCALCVLPENFFKLEKEEEEKGKDSLEANKNKNCKVQPQSDLRGDNLAKGSSSTSKVISESPSCEVKSKSKSLREAKIHANNKIETKPNFSLNGLLCAWICLMCLLLRPHNVPLVAFLSLIEQIGMPLIISSGIRPKYMLLFCLWMGQAFFFFQGNSNSVSTVDVSAGFAGITDYNPILIGLLIAVATYAGPVFWLLAFVKFMFVIHQRNKKRGRLADSLRSCCTTLLLTRALPLSIYTALVASQRYHLFVWTVFSPKLLYEGATTVLISVIIVFMYVMSVFA